MSPYPPGTSAGDPNAPWNAPDRSHEHRWHPVGLTPALEDGAAIFHQGCQYAEGEYGQGWQCEETRTYRFEEVHLLKLRTDKVDVCYTDIDRAMEIARLETALIGVYQYGEIVDCDPDPDMGYVVAEHDGWQVRFEA